MQLFFLSGIPCTTISLDPVDIDCLQLKLDSVSYHAYDAGMKTACKAIRIINLSFFDLLSCSRIYVTTYFRILAQALHGPYNSLEESCKMTMLDGYYQPALNMKSVFWGNIYQLPNITSLKARIVEIRISLNHV